MHLAVLITRHSTKNNRYSEDSKHERRWQKWSKEEVPPRRFERPTHGSGGRCSIRAELRGHHRIPWLCTILISQASSNRFIARGSNTNFDLARATMPGEAIRGRCADTQGAVRLRPAGYCQRTERTSAPAPFPDSTGLTPSPATCANGANVA